MDNIGHVFFKFGKERRTVKELTVGFGGQKPDVVGECFGDVVGQFQLDVRISVKLEHRRRIQKHWNLSV